MALTKLTLTVDEDVVRKAREYTQRHQTSISRLVTAFLNGLGEPESEEYPPVIRRLMGILPPSADEADYHRFLEEKYGT
ncbi:MAG: DUF6364 family protein [Longimicrobiaceae bacterium]